MLNEMLYVVKQIMYHEHWRPSGLKSGGALTKYVRGGTEKVEHIYLYIISGRGRKSGGVIALVALVRWAPLIMKSA